MQNYGHLLFWKLLHMTDRKKLYVLCHSTIIGDQVADVMKFFPCVSFTKKVKGGNSFWYIFMPNLNFVELPVS